MEIFPDRNTKKIVTEHKLLQTGRHQNSPKTGWNNVSGITVILCQSWSNFLWKQLSVKNLTIL